MYIDGAETRVLKWEEDINFSNVKKFKQHLQDFIQHGKAIYILNIEKVQYMNGASLDVVADTAKIVRENGGEFSIVGIQPTIERLFQIVFKTSEDFTCVQ